MKTFTDKIYYQCISGHVVGVAYVERMGDLLYPLVDINTEYGSEVTHKRAKKFLNRYSTEELLVFTIKIVKNPTGEHVLCSKDAHRGKLIYIDKMFIGSPERSSDMLCKTLQKALGMLGDEKTINVDVYITVGSETLKL